MDNNFEFKNLSESQRAMLKCRIKQLMINKYRRENFYDELNKELRIHNSFSWFECLNDFSIDDKIPQILQLLNVTSKTLFNTMNIVIKTKATAQALLIEYSSKEIFPLLVSGDKVFNALSTLSLASLSALEKDIFNQINYSKNNVYTNIDETKLIAESSYNTGIKETDNEIEYN